MKSSPKLKWSLWDGLVILAVLALAAACGFRFFPSGAEDTELVAVITIDGQETDRIPLRSFPEEGRSYSHNGYTLRVQASAEPSEEGVSVTESDCPTQDCVHTGVISRSGQSIVCLPARIVIELQGGDGGTDLIIG